MAKAKQITALNCPECGELVEIDQPNELAINDVLSCGECEADLIVVALDPVSVSVADEMEVDDEEEDDDFDEDGEEEDEEGEDDDDLDEEDDEED